MARLLRIGFRLIGLAILIAGLLLFGFILYKGSRPMHISEAHGMSYWQFMTNRIDAIRRLPAKCQWLHVTGYLLSVPLYPALYTFVGVFPNSFLAGHLQPDARIPKQVAWLDASGIWWSLVETISWEAWVTRHVPGVMPECNLKSLYP